MFFPYSSGNSENVKPELEKTGHAHHPSAGREVNGKDDLQSMDASNQDCSIQWWRLSLEKPVQKLRPIACYNLQFEIGKPASAD